MLQIEVFPLPSPPCQSSMNHSFSQQTSQPKSQIFIQASQADHPTEQQACINYRLLKSVGDSIIKMLKLVSQRTHFTLKICTFCFVSLFRRPENFNPNPEQFKQRPPCQGCIVGVVSWTGESGDVGCVLFFRPVRTVSGNGLVCVQAKI